MSLQVAKAKREERRNIVDQMNALVPPDGNMSAENLAKHAELDAAQEKLRKEIEAVERTDTLDKEMKARVERRAIQSGRDPGAISEEDVADLDAFNTFMKRGLNALSPEQRAIMDRRHQIINTAQTGGNDTLGGYIVPQGPMQSIQDAQKAFGGMTDAALVTRLDTDSGNALPIPTDDDTSNKGAVIGDNVTVTEKEITFGAVTINAHLYTSKLVKVPFALLQDAGFDLNGWLMPKLGVRIARAVNEHLTTGDGASKPKGVITAATLGVTAAGQAVVTSDELIDLEHSVDPAYRRGASFMMSDAMLKVIKKLKDGQGRPLWLSGFAVKEPDTINGYPYRINQDVAVPATTTKTIVFGDFKNYYVRKVTATMVMRLTERFADVGQVAFLAFERWDGNLVDAGTHPIKYLQQA